MPFDPKSHNFESSKFLKNFSGESVIILGDFKRILTVLEKEVRETLSSTEEAFSVAITDISTIQSEVSSVQVELDALIEKTLAELNDVVNHAIHGGAGARSPSVGSHNSGDLHQTGSDSLRALASHGLEARYPMTFCKLLLFKATDWNRAIDNWHRYLSSHVRTNTSVPANHQSALRDSVPDTSGDAAVAISSDNIHAADAFDNSDVATMSPVSALASPVDRDDETVTGSEAADEVHSELSLNFKSLAGHSSVAFSKPEQRRTSIFRGGMVKAFAKLGLISKENAGSKFSVPLDDLNKGRY